MNLISLAILLLAFIPAVPFASPDEEAEDYTPRLPSEGQIRQTAKLERVSDATTMKELDQILGLETDSPIFGGKNPWAHFTKKGVAEHHEFLEWVDQSQKDHGPTWKFMRIVSLASSDTIEDYFIREANGWGSKHSLSVVLAGWVARIAIIDAARGPSSQSWPKKLLSDVKSYWERRELRSQLAKIETYARELGIEDRVVEHFTEFNDLKERTPLMVEDLIKSLGESKEFEVPPYLAVRASSYAPDPSSTCSGLFI